MKARELRILITQKCNYNCSFCHKEGVNSTKKDLLTIDDYLFLYSFLRDNYGWETVTITGGEPLCNKITPLLSKELFNNNAKTTIVTNGSLILKYLEICNYVERINISLHTLNHNKYQQITNGNYSIEKIKSNISNLRKIFPNINIRLNCTLINGINTEKQEILNLLDFAYLNNSSIKFIELLPEKETLNLFYPIKNLERILQEENYFLLEESAIQKIYIKGNHIVILSRIVCSLSRQLKTSKPHCNDTNSLFLTSDGNIHPCMKNSFEISILDEIKNRDKILLNGKLQIFFNSVSLLCPYQK